MSSSDELPGLSPAGYPMPGQPNEYIRNRRAKFAEQLKDAGTMLQVCAMMLSEDDRHPLPVVESLFNRCDYVGRGLLWMLHSGFYGPINRGKLPSFEAQLKRNGALYQRMIDTVQQALDGSNLIEGYTDQGLPSDPNGKWPGMRIGGEVFNDWGGGPGGHAGAKRWRLEFMAGATAPSTPDEGAATA